MAFASHAVVAAAAAVLLLLSSCVQAFAPTGGLTRVGISPVESSVASSRGCGKVRGAWGSANCGKSSSNGRVGLAPLYMAKKPKTKKAKAGGGLPGVGSLKQKLKKGGKTEALSEKALRAKQAKLYRLLGLSVDASPADMQEAAERLKEKYKDNVQERVKVEIVEDQINEMLMQMRMSGVIKGKKNKTAEKARKSVSKKKNKAWYTKLFKPPKWIYPFLNKPTKEDIIKKTLYFAAYSAAVAGFAETRPILMIMAGATTVGFLGANGAPPLPRDETGRVSEIVVPSKFTSLSALGIVTSIAVVGDLLGNILAVIVGEKWVSATSLSFTVCCSMFWFCSVFLTTWREQGSTRRAGPGGGGNRTLLGG